MQRVGFIYIASKKEEEGKNTHTYICYISLSYSYFIRCFRVENCVIIAANNVLMHISWPRAILFKYTRVS